MYTIGICGHFAINREYYDGQTVKTRTLKKKLDKMVGTDKITVLDTFEWKISKIKFVKNILNLIINCKNIIILPAQRGIKLIVPMVITINLIFKRKIHYVVIGGWLAEFLQKNKYLVKYIKQIDCIYVETIAMKKKLQNMGIDNVVYFPNFKEINVLREEELVYNTFKPYKICTFSRVSKEKGIDDIISVVEDINKELGKTAYELDIYGQIDKKYENDFKKILSISSPEIKYKGVVEFNDSVNVLKDYFALCFPTYYEGEGFAGTLIDALSAGTPSFVSDWKYNSEIILDGINGKIFKTRDKNDMKRVLLNAYTNPDQIFAMKKKCIESANNYQPDKVIHNLIKYLE